MSPEQAPVPSAKEVVEDAAWDQRIFAIVPSGVDGASIVENLRRTPTERLRRMLEMARFLEHARDRGPAAP
jgi:hypothetical protein